MGKTRAEIQNSYRERKKLSDPNYLAKERKRASENRTPAALLSKKKLSERREKNRKYSKRYRNSKKEDNIKQSQNELLNSVTLESQELADRKLRSKKENQLFVSFQFKNRKTVPKRRSTALRKAQWEKDNCKEQIKNKNKLAERWKKRYIRLKDSIASTSTAQAEASTSQDIGCLTPVSKTQSELRSAGVSPRQIPPQVLKKIEFKNCLLEEIKTAREVNKAESDRRVIDSIISGPTIKKYKHSRRLSKEINIDRKIISKVCTKKLSSRSKRKRKGKARYEILKSTVVNFLESDEISRCMPGKNDAFKVDNEKKQTRILNDYLRNIHENFCLECPEINISFSSFCKLRPKYIKTTSLLTRNTCLCTVHQNMALKLKCLRSLAVDIPAHPKTAKRTLNVEEFREQIEKINDDLIEYEQSKRVEVDGKKRMRIVKNSMKKEEFLPFITKEFESSLQHTERIAAQYKALNELKTNLPEGHAIVQMDFAENFQCQTIDEIQSAYWNATSVTLHPLFATIRKTIH